MAGPEPHLVRLANVGKRSVLDPDGISIAFRTRLREMADVWREEIGRRVRIGDAAETINQRRKCPGRRGSGGICRGGVNRCTWIMLLVILYFGKLSFVCWESALPLGVFIGDNWIM